MDPAPARYMIRINGHLGATMPSAFPALVSQHHGAHTVLTGMAVPEPSLSRGRSVTGGSAAIDPGVPDHRDPVMISRAARSNPGSTGRAPLLPGTIRQRLRGEGNDHRHRAT